MKFSSIIESLLRVGLENKRHEKIKTKSTRKTKYYGSILDRFSIVYNIPGTGESKEKNYDRITGNIKRIERTMRKEKKAYLKEEEEKDNKNNNKMNKNISELSSDLNMNEYKMIKLIGSGSYSNIYLIENYKSKKQYAAKKIITDGENELEKIKMEIEIIKTLSELNEEEKKD